MKFILGISFFIFVAVATPVIIFNSAETNNVKVMNEQSDSTKLSPQQSWFETNLDIYIPEEYMAIDLTRYKQDISEGAKDTLAFEYWLGNATIKGMYSKDGYIAVDFSTEEHTKIMFITPTYFALTSYMNVESDKELTHGSSVVYFPEKNILRELDTIIVYSVHSNMLVCSLEHYNIGEPESKEFGRYDVTKGRFIKQNK